MHSLPSVPTGRCRPIASLPALALALAACGPTTSVLDRPAPNSDFVRVLVEAHDGFVDPEPAHAEAARQCGERLQQSVFFMAHPVGTDDRMFVFRCE